MAKPQIKTAPFANNANDLSTEFAFALPRSPDDVADFLFQAAYAIGQREADLARVLDVSRATLSSWKSRGVIPAGPLEWFREAFVIEVLQGRAPPQHEGFRHAGVELALGLFAATDFNPFNLSNKAREDLVTICYRSLGPISRLGLFVLRRTEAGLTPADGPVSDVKWSVVLPRLGALTALAGPEMF